MQSPSLKIDFYPVLQIIFVVVLRNAATVPIDRSADSRFHWKQHMVAWHGVVRRGRCCGNIIQMSAKGRSMLVRLWMSA